MAENIQADIKQTKAQIETKLKTGNGDLTIKDSLWLLLAIADEMEQLAEYHTKCEARKWYNAFANKAQAVVVTLLVAAALLGVLSVIQSGFRLP